MFVMMSALFKVLSESGVYVDSLPALHLYFQAPTEALFSAWNVFAFQRLVNLNFIRMMITSSMYPYFYSNLINDYLFNNIIQIVEVLIALNYLILIVNINFKLLIFFADYDRMK